MWTPPKRARDHHTPVLDRAPRGTRVVRRPPPPAGPRGRASSQARGHLPRLARACQLRPSSQMHVHTLRGPAQVLTAVTPFLYRTTRLRPTTNQPTVSPTLYSHERGRRKRQRERREGRSGPGTKGGRRPGSAEADGQTDSYVLTMQGMADRRPPGTVPAAVRLRSPWWQRSTRDRCRDTFPRRSGSVHGLDRGPAVDRLGSNPGPPGLSGGALPLRGPTEARAGVSV